MRVNQVSDLTGKVPYKRAKMGMREVKKFLWGHIVSIFLMTELSPWFLVVFYPFPLDYHFQILKSKSAMGL